MIRIVGGLNTTLKRLRYMKKTIISLINQSVKFDKIYLVLNFKNKNQIPKYLLISNIFEIINSNNNFII